MSHLENCHNEIKKVSDYNIFIKIGTISTMKRSSSAPMINQLGVISGAEGTGVSLPSTPPPCVNISMDGSKHSNNEMMDAASSASSFLSSLDSTRPRRFSASFSPIHPCGSPGPAPNRVNQLRHENTTDWETVSEKEFHGTNNIAQSWEDLSLDSMSMEVATRRPSISDQLWLSMPASSAPSSPVASPKVLSRFSPSLSSPSPTRKSFTTRRSLSPIAVRPSVLALATANHGVKRKCDWESQMDCSPQPPKRLGGLLSFNPGVASPTSPFSASTSTPESSSSGPSFYGAGFQVKQGPLLCTPSPSTRTDCVTDSPLTLVNNVDSSQPSVNTEESPTSSLFRPISSANSTISTSQEESPPNKI